MKFVLYWLAALALAAGITAVAQVGPGTPTPLASLIAEAEANNSQISAANDSWRAATHLRQQATTLPDPKFAVQQFSVGSPKPFAGYTNSDFSYIGIGVSQELPYPGKLRLRGEVAGRSADVKQAEADATAADVADAVKTDYLELAYLQRTLGILAQNEPVLDTIIQDALAHYKVGHGTQQDVLEAQLRRTQLLRQITERRTQAGQVEAHLKALLHRDQGSADILAASLTETPLRKTSAELLDMVRAHNPQVQIDAESVREQDAKLASAKREGRPDFDLGYMYQNTDRKYRDYYMLTFDVRLPRRGRTNAQVAQAAEMLAHAKDSLDAHLEQQLAEARQQYVKATGDAELLKEYREGLLPQSEAAYAAMLKGYAADRGEFIHVLAYFTDLLNLKIEFAQTLADHEAALARLETLTGATLR